MSSSKALRRKCSSRMRMTGDGAHTHASPPRGGADATEDGRPTHTPPEETTRETRRSGAPAVELLACLRARVCVCVTHNRVKHEAHVGPAFISSILEGPRGQILTHIDIHLLK